MKGTNVHIYVDTNVIRNYFTKQPADVACLDYIFSKRKKEILFTSSLAVIQAVSGLQKASKPNHRKAFTRQQALESIDFIFKKFTVLDFSKKDILETYSLLNNDVEDNTHYILSKKAKCETIITNDLSDFASFQYVEALSPQNYALIKRKIQ